MQRLVKYGGIVKYNELRKTVDSSADQGKTVDLSADERKNCVQDFRKKKILCAVSFFLDIRGAILYTTLIVRIGGVCPSFK